jgi:predicted helicase
MITNHSYLDNPTFRGMRRSLMETFDEIHVLDLHGNSLRRETCPDGSKDENVFDIRQGVAIAFFVKTGEGEGPATVRHAEAWGLRGNKYAWLREHDLQSTEWQEISPKSEFYLFHPRDEADLDTYDDFLSVPDIFPLRTTGIKTHRDDFVLDMERKRLERRMRHMLAGNNLALITNRRVALPAVHHTWVSRFPTDFHVLETAHASAYVFPLHVYPDSSKNKIFNTLPENGELRPNLDAGLLSKLRHFYGKESTPEDLFHYVYAILQDPTYREKYSAFLKMDFPKVPLTTDRDLFGEMAKLGKRLVGLHLLDSHELDPPIVQFWGEGNNHVVRRKSEGFRYEEQSERKYINRTQYFHPVPLELWEYQVGGYQVLRKWLKDRKDRELTTDEIRTYCHIVTALRKTIDIQEELDALYPRVEENIIELDLGS